MAQVLSEVRRTPLAEAPRALPRWDAHWRQVLLVSAAVFGYFTARGLAGADPTRAVQHAGRLVAFEKWAHLYQEPQLQQLVDGHRHLITMLNWVYIWGHWPVIVAVLIWLVRTRPAPYRVLRNALFVSGAIGLLFYLSYPVAPPRLAGLGLVDTITAQSHSYRVLQPPAFVNQYAALPSLHVGWNLLVGIFLVRHGRHLLVRALGVLTPIAMTAAVVLTANHYIVDVLLGAVVALVGLAVARRMSRTW